MRDNSIRESDEIKEIDLIKEIVERLEKANRIQQNMTNVLVRQSTLIARLNERMIKLEETVDELQFGSKLKV